LIAEMVGRIDIAIERISRCVGFVEVIRLGVWIWLDGAARSDETV
jgi:hypothetical protein